jgi:hypothetical protein
MHAGKHNMRAQRRTRAHTHTHLDPHVFVHCNDVLYLEAVAWPCADPHLWPVPTDVASVYSPCLPTSRLFIARAYRRRVCLWPVPLYSAASAAPAQCAADATGLTAAVHSTRHRSRDCATAEYSPDFFATCVTWTSPFFRKPSIATKQPYLHACNGARARAQNANGLGHARTDVHT